jgi:Tol biopolymer transport system component
MGHLRVKSLKELPRPASRIRTKEYLCEMRKIEATSDPIIHVLFFSLLTFVFVSVFGPAEAQIEHRPVLINDQRGILLMSDRDGDMEIYRISLNDAEVDRLTNHQGWDGYPVLSPNGSQFVFARETQRTSLNPSGQRPHIFDFATREIRELTEHPYRVAATDWLEDGSRILAFVEVDGRRDLFWINVESGQLTRITNTIAGNEHDAILSSNDTHIYTAVVLHETGSAIDLMQISSGQRERIVQSPGYIYGLALSPDGRHLTYTESNSQADRHATLMILDTTTFVARAISSGDVVDQMAVWMDDGEHLLFTSYRGDDEDLYLLHLESGFVIRVATE